MKKLIFLFSTLLFSVLVFGQASSPAPAVQAVDSWSAWVQSHLGLGGSLAAVMALVEILIRAVPTDKPRSLILLCAQLGHSIAAFLENISKVLDDVLQNTSQPGK